MIDTIKIYTNISFEIYEKIYKSSIVKVAFSNKTNEKFYEIVNDHLKGSYDSSLSVRVGNGIKYKFTTGYFLEIEGSLHKIMKGQNAYGGYYNLETICLYLIQLVESAYDIMLPNISEWYLQRVDIAVCYDLGNQENVRKYINNLSSCSYPKRNLKFYQDESLYVSGTSSTLKIYNKFLEFVKHDLRKLKNTDFDINNFCEYIKGFVRFECEIKKKMLKKFFDIENIPVNMFSYDMLKEKWCDEFMKLLKFVDDDLKIVRSREDVYKRLNTLYKSTKANNLYNFYMCIMFDGISEVKMRHSKTSFYRNISDLKKAHVDLSQKYDIQENNLIEFNPFEWKEVV